MMRRRHSNTLRQPGSPATPDRDPLDAIPTVAEGVEARKDSSGRVQIQGPQAGKTAIARLARRMGMQRRVRVNLDAYGSLFWDQIDGKRSLKSIAQVIRERTGQSGPECEQAVIGFTRTLMLRHLIWLAVSQREDAHE